MVEHCTRWAGWSPSAFPELREATPPSFGACFELPARFHSDAHSRCILGSLDAMPDGTTDCSHGKGATEVIEDNVRARISVMCSHD